MSYTDDIFAKAGIDAAINQAASYSRGVASTGSSKPAVAPKQPGFLQDVVSSAKAALPAVAGVVGHALADPFVKFSNAISGAVNSGSFNKTQDYQRSSVDQQMKSLAARYKSTDPKVKISKAQFDAGLKDVQDQYNQLNSANQQYGEQLGTPGEAVKAGAEVLSTPLAFGKLAKTGEAVSGALDASQTAGQLAKGALKGAVKAPLVVQPVAGTPVDIAHDVKAGNYAGAAGNAALLATGLIPGGGPVGLAGKAIGAVGKATQKAIYGEESLFKSIKTADGTLLDYVKGLETKAQAGSKRAAEDLKVARVYQQYKLDETGGNVKSAVRELEEHYANRPTAEISGKDVFTDFKKFYKNTQKVKEADRLGNIPRESSQANLSARVGRFSVGDNEDLKSALRGVADPGERYQIAAKIAETSDWGKNPTLRQDILEGVSKDDFNGKIPVTALRAQGKVAGLDRGYFPILTKNARAEFKPVEQTASKFDETKPLLPGLRSILRKTGLSSESADPTVFSRIEADANKKINGLGITSVRGSESSSETIGQQVTNKLSHMVENTTGVSDVRQLRAKDIATELGINPIEARKVRQAVSDAHFAVSLGERGLGARIQDANLKFNPLAAGYSRVQGTLKYERNPFFQAQALIETEILGQGLAGPNLKSLQRLFGKDTSSKTLDIMRANGFFKGERGAAGGIGGPFVSAKLSNRQQRMLSGTVETLAENRGVSVNDLMQDGKIRDELRAIVQYPEKGIFSSNLARTANLAFFPVSYNFKVASLAAKALARTSPITQIATIKGVNDFNNWLDSDDGIKWSSKNSEVLGLLNYFTPINSIQSVLNLLGGNGKPVVSDLGIIGGLPFGVISQILEHHGLFTTDRPYADPKTGQVVPEKIPADLKASAATVLTDLINSVYNFPGRKVGINLTKANVTQSLPGLSDLAKSGKYNTRTRTDLTPTQQRAQRVLSPSTPSPTATTPANKLNVPTVSATSSSPLVLKKASTSTPKAKKPKIYARPLT